MNTRRGQLEERLARLENSLALARSSYDELLANPKKSASLDTGNGRVSFSNRDLKAFSDSIHGMEAEIDKIRRQLCGGTVVNFGLRRHG